MEFSHEVPADQWTTDLRIWSGEGGREGRGEGGRGEGVREGGRG